MIWGEVTINSGPKILYFLTGFLFILVFLCGSATAATINVNNNTPNAIGNALGTANAGDTLNLSAGIYKEHDLVINQNLTITGPETSGEPTAVIDADKQGRVFYVPVGSISVNLNYLTIQNGVSMFGGGIFIDDAELNINNCMIKDNIASDASGINRGGGIYNLYGKVNITRSTISNNIADLVGGGVYNGPGKVDINHSTIISNSAKEGGGGIYNDGQLTVTNCNFISNTGNFGIGIGNGKAVYNNGQSNLHFNRFNDPSLGYEIFCENGNVNAENNWWGSNNSPSGNISGDVDFTPWIVDISGSPTISSSNPLNGATNIAASKIIIINFNEYVESGDLQVELKNMTGATIPSNIYLNDQILTVDPNSNLAESIYTLIIHTGAVTDIMGNPVADTIIRFSVGTSPFITSSNPTYGATNIAANKTIIMTFNEVIKKGSNFWVELKNSSGTAIAYTSSFNGKVLVIDPKINLAESPYTLIIHTGAVTDLSGNPAAAKIIKFSVGTPPKVIATTPNNLKTGFTRTGTIIIKFSENIYPGPYYSRIMVKNLTTGRTTSITKAIRGNLLYIKNSSIRSSNILYQIIIPAGAVKDRAGNILAKAYTFKFKTGIK